MVKQDNSEKKILGQFFTSNRIAQYIVEKMELDESKTVADLSCGDGVFLCTCCDILKGMDVVAPAQIISNIYGIEISQEHLKNTKENLVQLAKINPSTLDENLILADTIHSTTQQLFEKFPRIAKSKGFDVVVGNPPYLSIPTSDAIKSDPIFSQIVTGQINAATLMIGRAYSMLKEGGKLGLLLPKTILRVNSYKKLRDFLISNFYIEELIDVGIEFDDVRGEQFILIATKKLSSPTNIKIGYFYKNKPLETHVVPFEEITKFDNFLLLENKMLYELIDKIVGNHPQLDSLSDGQICRGIAIGANSKKVSLTDTNNGHQGLRGDSIKKFRWDYFVYIEKDEDYSKLNKIKTRKIVLQNIFSSEAGIIANWDGDGLVTLDTITNIMLHDDVDQYYVLGILNSVLMRFFMVFAVYGKSRLTMHTDRKYIGRIPIPCVSDELRNAIVFQVDRNMRGMSTTPNPKLDDLIFEAFNLTVSEQDQIIQQLQKFDHMGKKTKVQQIDN